LRSKAKVSYVDSHDIHLTEELVDYLNLQRVHPAGFPPHSAHTIQPLDVVLFNSLSSACSLGLTTHISVAVY
jgi:hypothetical protein